MKFSLPSLSSFFGRPASTHLSVYGTLLELGHTDTEIREAASGYAPTRGFKLALSDFPEETPIVGVTYGCDFRSEEEYGVGQLQKAFGLEGHSYVMTKAAGKGRVAVFDGLPAGAGSLILSTRKLAPVQTWGANIVTEHTDPVAPPRDAWLTVLAHGSGLVAPGRGGDYYDSHYAWSLASMQKLPEISEYWKIAAIKEEAVKLGIPGPFPRKKDELLDYVRNHPVRQAQRDTTVWPGWFHNGDVLVLRADTGIVADTLKLLVQAASAGSLAFGGGSQIFGSGMSIYDGLDVGPKLRKSREAAAAWYDAEMQKLEPVKEKLRSRGFHWYALGHPTRQTDGSVRYWLNGSGQPQPFGWYTREDLLAERFVADAENRAAEWAKKDSK